ncbi:hypothetical protein BC828DRAFT_377307 [Blastocladiella britannica]|nr:hypothetical protein BC828DRAFT_377307 [Blastocladiella britannica]
MSAVPPPPPAPLPAVPSSPAAATVEVSMPETTTPPDPVAMLLAAHAHIDNRGTKLALLAAAEHVAATTPSLLASATATMKVADHAAAPAPAPSISAATKRRFISTVSALGVPDSALGHSTTRSSSSAAAAPGAIRSGDDDEPTRPSILDTLVPTVPIIVPIPPDMVMASGLSFSVYAPQPDADPADFLAYASLTERAEAGDPTVTSEVPAGATLDPAKSLEDFVKRPELSSLQWEVSGPRVLEGVMHMVTEEKLLHNALVQFARALHNDRPEAIELGELELETLRETMELIGSTGEVLEQLRDISVGLSHVKHQQKFLWNEIAAKTQEQREDH